MGARRLGLLLRKGGGIILAVGGIWLVVGALPHFLWPLALGVLSTWFGWQLYIFERY